MNALAQEPCARGECCISDYDRGTTELQEWIDTINLVAASLSSPPLPSGVGSQARFQRPLMPSACTKLGIVSPPFAFPGLSCFLSFALSFPYLSFFM